MASKDHPLARLREAREGRSLSLEELAGKLGVQRQVVYKYEHGRVKPSPLAVARFCAALNVPVDFFSRSAPEPEPSPVFFRHFRSKTNKKQLAAVTRQLAWVRDFVTVLEQYVVLPEVSIPDFHPPSDPRQITETEIEDSATALRGHWGFRDGVIRDVVKLVENNGCIVVAELVKANAIDAFSLWSKRGRPIVVVGCREVSGVHRRFDVAHELGHLLMHRNIDKRFLQLNPDTHKLVEDQAFRFARAFLMPAASFRKSLTYVSLDSLLLLKQHWHLSVGAMLKRAVDLEMIDASAESGFWAKRNRRKWRDSEPFDDMIPPEEPRLLGNAIRALKADDPENLNALCDEVGLQGADVARYCGLEEEEVRPGVVDDVELTLKLGDGSRASR
ncbi:MAG TPA: XRE family transcriptional regulator [Candidatus Eremiobacteraceae bacterium]|nr:XRE family transcriptional regulator [Candidatus Eremiobacteraceae bacterium]